jgi:hypothetical protein
MEPIAFGAGPSSVKTEEQQQQQQPADHSSIELKEEFKKMQQSSIPSVYISGEPVKHINNIF